jgi:hypothetical protein
VVFSLKLGDAHPRTKLLVTILAVAKFKLAAKNSKVSTEE